VIKELIKRALDGPEINLGIDVDGLRPMKIIAVTTACDEKVKNIADDVVYIPCCRELLTPVLSGIALHLLTYYLSEEIARRGLGKPNLDHPRNLAKSVTVE
jgi:glutamine---fructose-6-phosphate transaminase (isomerizing)